jgi:Cell wall-active antibiotics response 4TMS YvqF
MSTGARSNLANVVVGFCIMMVGVLLILDRLGMVDAAWALQFWPAALILFGGALILQAIRGGDATQGGGRFPVGAVIWLVLLGLFFTNIFERRSNAARGGTDEKRLFGLLSGDKRVSGAEEFRGAEMTSIMGGTELDLRQAVIAPGDTAVIDVFALMGGAVVYVPDDWIVDIETTAVMGGVKDERRRPFGVTGEQSGDETDDERRERRRRGRRGEWEPPELPELPPLDGIVTPAPVPSAPSVPPAVEREDPAATSAGPQPRIVLRGFVMMGGLVIKS